MSNDLISRDDAIDAIRRSTKKYNYFMGMENYTDEDAIEAVMSVPTIVSISEDDIDKCTKIRCPFQVCMISPECDNNDCVWKTTERHDIERAIRTELAYQKYRKERGL